MFVDCTHHSVLLESTKLRRQVAILRSGYRMSSIFHCGRNSDQKNSPDRISNYPLSGLGPEPQHSDLFGRGIWARYSCADLGYKIKAEAIVWTLRIV